MACYDEYMETFDLTPADPERADKLAHYLLRAINKANRKYHLFADGDTILVAVSGGKDSMTLLDLLRRRQATGRERYRLIAAHIHSDYYCGRTVPEEWLEAWCAAHHIPLVIESISVAEDIARMRKSHCFRCAWVRRKTLFDLADRLGCNVIAFAHHADDIAETVLMNLFYNARLAWMAPRVSFFGGKITVIRPLALVEERDIPPFVQASGFPISGEPCPSALGGRRLLIKRFLRELESENHRVKRSIFAAMHRLSQGERAPSMELEENA